ncbi:uncharacterized protein LOC102804307 [Saccoglossus kowalevskii]|uniref:Uncharacterized protein LOC102804307 n=1 Tax=Saccoglossus kowalevskii TaxID=10224 RepID=A0ABM0LX61_SACKO|nr:PREDICTED: uncharacterized protein LOC102804307 [Saccoglossus kowalevskii]
MDQPDNISVSSSASTASSKARAAAKGAALKVRLQRLAQTEALELEELKLKQQRIRFEQETQLAESEAEERVYEALESNPVEDVTKGEEKLGSQVLSFEDPWWSAQPPQGNVNLLSPLGVNDVTLPSPALPLTTGQSGTPQSKQQSTHVEEQLVNISQQSTKSQSDQSANVITEMGNIMFRKELLSSSLRTFNDSATSYRAWKALMMSTISELNVPPSQQVNLIMRWLGNSSRELVTPLQSVYVDKPIEALKHIWNLLDQTYGAVEVIEQDLMNRLQEFPRFTIKESIKLQHLDHLLLEVLHMKESGKYPGLASLDSAHGLNVVIQKLPPSLKVSWMKHGASFKTNNNVLFPPFEVFYNFIHQESVMRNDPSFSVISNQQKESGRSFAVSVSPHISESKPFRRNCPLCSSSHWLSQCGEFKEKSVGERRRFVQEKKLCRNCLNPGHFVSTCRKGSFCKLCADKHSSFLHPVTTHQTTTPSNSPASSSIQAQNLSESHQGTSTAVTCKNSIIGFAAVPVSVRCSGGRKTVKTYAFLDNGSNISFCTESLAQKLGVQGKKTEIDLKTIDRTSTNQRRLLTLEISNLNGDIVVMAPEVFTIPTLPVDSHTIAKQEDINKWPHLDGVQVTNINEEVGLLIGTNIPELHQPLEVKTSTNGGPYATRTLCGWVVNGPLYIGQQENMCNFINSNRQCLEYPSLDEQFKTFCNIDFNDTNIGKTVMSRDDLKAINIMKRSICFEDGHYQVAMPWKTDPQVLPNNKSMALKRLNSLKVRLEKDYILKVKYTKFMEGLVQDGYARKVCSAVGHESRWFLPHHPVIHPQKPEKVRIVFDCSAKYKDVCLNDLLLQGPDLTSSLMGVLMRFRLSQVAFSADVEKMFYQVRVPETDSHYLTYLWWENGNLNNSPQEYQMRVHLFGGRSSPSCSNFALRNVAKDRAGEHEQNITNTIENNFYVDDCLKSLDSEDEAISTALNLKHLLAKGGFNLTKWSSNSVKLLNALQQDKSKDLSSLGGGDLQRALGVQWFIKEDSLGYVISPKTKPSTRRGILSVVASVYDPLGLVSPFILKAKFLLRELCLLNCKWDQDIPKKIEIEWNKWLSDLSHLTTLRIRRSYKEPKLGAVVYRELHHFGDASSTGYGAVSYLCQKDAEGIFSCALVAAKSRLAPVKMQTIPRMELQAAVLACRLDQMIRDELQEIKIDKSILWTDSTCVLRYINNETTRFKTFVGNRIATILSHTSKDQWHYIPSMQNPADLASRGMRAMELIKSDLWFSGPEFLKQDESEWPQYPADLGISERDPELKAVSTVSVRRDCSVSYLMNHFSSWPKLIKVVAWILRWKHIVKSKGKGVAGPISVEEWKGAEISIVKYIQQQSYAAEVQSLRNGQQVNSNSPLVKFDPILVEGVMRVGGRLRNSQINEDAKHQIILPKGHHVTTLIVRHYHICTGHSGTNHTLSEIRQRFWPIGGRATAKATSRNCVDCRKRHARPPNQKMADLPIDRVTPALPPFTCVGIDCFGPFYVKNGRSMLKRYGIIFTCLTTRAVHLEVAYSLDTNSFLNGLRRFIARRGKPQLIRSDNGGNFVKGERELRLAIENWNQEQIHQYLLQNQVEWKFNPPTASHQGGVWERCIRTVRKVLSTLTTEQTVNDEVLHTLFCEVEMIVNGRPITRLSDDSKDCETLTPNHLLLLRAGPKLPPGVFVKEDCYVRKRWRQAQYLADVFWHRWIKEYLPALQERQKWRKARDNVKMGDVVLVHDPSAPRCSWPLAQVVEVFRTTSDNMVRSVKLRTSTGMLVRPITKIVCLEISGKD